ncbi:hypothetical protein LCGC14_0515180 [marine sediment metagenome]|uniref:Uncharacterized protein n=1 Tax=marine sediment metagenome TaxID=412755 RepID=A0A0F9SIK3_9ZZZZ
MEDLNLKKIKRILFDIYDYRKFNLKPFVSRIIAKYFNETTEDFLELNNINKSYIHLTSTEINK